jgi:hypothetical protein
MFVGASKLFHVEQFGLAVQAKASRGTAQNCSTWNNFEPWNSLD